MGGPSVPASREVRVLLALQTPPASAQARLLPPQVPYVSLKFPQMGSDSDVHLCLVSPVHPSTLRFAHLCQVTHA